MYFHLNRKNEGSSLEFANVRDKKRDIFLYIYPRGLNISLIRDELKQQMFVRESDGLVSL